PRPPTRAAACSRSCSPDRRPRLGPLSFPTRRSSDLPWSIVGGVKALIAAGALAAGLTLAAPAHADLDFGHGGQLGLRVGLVGGYRMVLRYDESPYCVAPDPTRTASDQQKFCGHGAPLALDLALGFAPFDFIEPFAWARLGLARETQTDTDAIVILGAGARLYTMSDSAFKIYVEPALGFELEGGGDDPRYAVGNYGRDL